MPGRACLPPGRCPWGSRSALFQPLALLLTPAPGVTARWALQSPVSGCGKAGWHQGTGCRACPALVPAWEVPAQVGAGGRLCVDASVDVLPVPAFPMPPLPCPGNSAVPSPTWFCRGGVCRVREGGWAWARCSWQSALCAFVEHVGPVSWSQHLMATSVHVPPAVAESGRGGGACCSQLTWLEGLPFFVSLVFVSLSAQHFSGPGAPLALCRALPQGGGWGQLEPEGRRWTLKVRRGWRRAGRCDSL